MACGHGLGTICSECAGYRIPESCNGCIIRDSKIEELQKKVVELGGEP